MLKTATPVTDAICIQDEREPRVVFFDIELDDAMLTPDEFRVYARLARRCSGKTKGYCNETAGAMAAACRMARATFFKAIAGLLSRNMIARRQTQGAVTYYGLTDRSQWKAVQDVNTVSPMTRSAGEHLPVQPVNAPCSAGEHMKKTSKEDKERVCVVKPALTEAAAHTSSASPSRKNDGLSVLRGKVQSHEFTAQIIKACCLPEINDLDSQQLRAIDRILCQAASSAATAHELGSAMALKAQQKGGAIPDVNFVSKDFGQLLGTVRGMKTEAPKPAAPTPIRTAPESSCGRTGCVGGVLKLDGHPMTMCQCHKNYDPYRDPIGQTEEARAILADREDQKRIRASGKTIRQYHLEQEAANARSEPVIEIEF